MISRMPGTPRNVFEMWSKGYRIFPLKNGSPAHLGKGFYEHLPTDLELVVAMFEEHPGDIAIWTKASGVIVADVDEGGNKTGIKQWEALLNELGPPNGWPVHTKSGGFHVFWLAHASRNNAKLAPHIDVRADSDGYVAAYGRPDHYRAVDKLEFPAVPWQLKLNETGRVVDQVKMAGDVEESEWEPSEALLALGERWPGVDEDRSNWFFELVNLAYLEGAKSGDCWWLEGTDPGEKYNGRLQEQFYTCWQKAHERNMEMVAVDGVLKLVPKEDADMIADLQAFMEQDAYDEEVDHDEWLPMDIRPYLDGTVKVPQPSVGLTRADGVSLVYPGLEHIVMGEMESGKSWFGCLSAVEELQRGHNVLYIHFEEDNPLGTAERLKLLGAPVDVLCDPDRFRFLGVSTQTIKRESFSRTLDFAPTLVVIDGVNEGMSLHGQAIREEDGAAAFRRLIIKPCTRVGAAVISLDHVVKNKESRGRFAIGSVHKSNAVNGAILLMETEQPFGRGMEGLARLYVVKDRPGMLRRHGRHDPNLPGKTYMGDFIVDDSSHVLKITLAEPREDLEELEPKKGGRPSKVDEIKEVILMLHAEGVSRSDITKMISENYDVSVRTVQRGFSHLLSSGEISDSMSE